jgi:DNA mismatch repair ATPase MutS
LKTTLINIILSQHYGIGCYSSAILQPYNTILCYLNIPDTSDRDSLFQAEARRCLDILNTIEKNKERSICIFDELYSGTNPDEAIQAAYAYLSYLVNQPITFLLTTHYYRLCELENKYNSIKNIHMESIKQKNNGIHFTYKIKEGISNIKGGINVLKELNYPETILHNL